MITFQQPDLPEYPLWHRQKIELDNMSEIGSRFPPTPRVLFTFYEAVPSYRRENH